MSNTTESRIRNYLGANFPTQVPAAELPTDQSLLDTGVIDSIGVLSLVMFLEEEFSITVSDDEVLPENLESISKLVNYVTRKSAESGGQP